jgi:hypothetical protein
MSPTTRRPAQALYMGVLAVLTLLIGASGAHAQGQPLIVNGTATNIEKVPWQILLYSEAYDSMCGGSVLNATTILTAAHCVTTGTSVRSASAYTVVAGITDGRTWQPGGPAPSGSQVVPVSRIRVHPRYVAVPAYSNDVAVLTLGKPLKLSTARTRAIAMAPVGGAPAPGTSMLVSGYGAQSPGKTPNGKLYSTSVAMLSDLDCLSAFKPNQTAGAFCAQGTNTGACTGDSGGPLVAGGVLVGVVSAGIVDPATKSPCTVSRPTLYADVTAPEVRAFIDGSGTPPVAPLLTGNPVLSSLNPPVVGSPITCAPGQWSGAASVTYAFVAGGAVLQAGPGAAFIPAAAHVGAQVMCVVQVGNPGGVSTARSGVAPAVQPDAVAPRAVLRKVRCRKRRCKVRLQAMDPNSQGALSVRVRATKPVRGRCGKGKGRKRRGARCTKRRTKPFAVRHVEGVRWVASARRVPRGKVTIRLRVVDAAGNRASGRHLKRRVRVR